MLAYLTYLLVLCFNLGEIVYGIHQFSNIKLLLSILRSFFLQSFGLLCFKISQMSVVRYVNFVWLVIYEKVEHINKNEQTRYETKVKRNRHVFQSSTGCSFLSRSRNPETRTEFGPHAVTVFRRCC